MEEEVAANAPIKTQEGSEMLFRDSSEAIASVKACFKSYLLH